jgi:hypothetical protein
MSRYTTLTDGMLVVDQVTEGNYTYYGMVRFNGEWLIMRQKTDDSEYRFKIGAHDYSTNWTNRTSLEYGLPIKAE